MRRVDLYAADLGDAAWRTVFRREDGGNGSRVELAPVPGVPGAWAVVDTRRPFRPPLMFYADELALIASYVDAWAAGTGGQGQG